MKAIQELPNFGAIIELHLAISSQDLAKVCKRLDIYDHLSSKILLKGNLVDPHLHTLINRLTPSLVTIPMTN